MKIGIFTDSHYSSQEITCGKRYNSKSLEKIRDAYMYFEESGCDLAICLGDLIDKENNHEKEMENLGRVAEVISKSSIPTVCLMGNHDAFALSEEEFYTILGKNCKPRTLCMDNKNFLFVDACYFKNGKHYQPGDSDWTDTFYPKEEEVAQLLAGLNEDSYVFMHQNIDHAISQDHRLFNADKMCRLIEDSRVVKAVYQGHYHPGKYSESGNVQYVTFPAMCEGDGRWYVVEI